MSLFLPTASLKNVTQITEELLQKWGIHAVFLDVDNTLAKHGRKEPLEGAVEWSKRLAEAGFELVIISNNYRTRVEPFAALFQLPFIHFAAKPLPKGYLAAKRRLKRETLNSQCLVVGDQVFTDIIGANLCGMKSVLLEPVELENTFVFHLKRKWEKPFRDRAKGRETEK